MLDLASELDNELAAVRQAALEESERLESLRFTAEQAAVLQKAITD